MKFLLMLITDESTESTLSSAEVDRIIAQHTAVSRDLRAAGKWVDSRRLRFSRDATTLRRRADTWVTCDGPFAESKEQIGGFYLIEAESKDEAVSWAQKLPLREAGAIEIRPARTGAQGRTAVRGAQEFLVFFIGDYDKAQSKETVFRAIDSHYELSLDLAVQGKFVSSRALEPSTQATTVRWKNGQHVISDGPFAETKEFVAGYFIIACDSRAEALRWAEQLTGGEVCEVRPVWTGEAGG